MLILDSQDPETPGRTQVVSVGLMECFLRLHLKPSVLVGGFVYTDFIILLPSTLV